MVLLSSHIRSFVFRSFLFSWSPMFFHFSLALSLSPALTLTHSLHQHYVHITKLKIPIALQNVQYRLEVAVLLFPFLRNPVFSLELYIKKL